MAITNEENNRKGEENFDIRKRIEESIISADAKEELLGIVNGERLANLYSDAVIKKTFSPDLHPERLDFLLQKIMKTSDIEVDHSAANENVPRTQYSKKIISDIPAWLKDRKRADLEIQAAAQNFIFKRADIYSSEMLFIQYSADEGQKKSETDYDNLKGVILVVLMVKSPQIFKDFESDRYIHRITEATADSGMVFPMLRQMAFVQLDKALEEYLLGTYNKDEDIELLKLLAMIADINNEKVRNETAGDAFFDGIRKDVSDFSADKEVQTMLLEEKMAILDMQMTKAEGRAEGRAEMKNLISWLFEIGRGKDVEKLAKDDAYYNQLLDEYMEAHNENNS